MADEERIMNVTVGVSLMFLIGAAAGYYAFKHYRQTGGLV